VEFKHLLKQREKTAAFALNFFDQTQGILHNSETEERQLLWAVAIRTTAVCTSVIRRTTSILTI
jgi:HD-like signal output (HDOD) protein